jgi:ADP-heptose:LPS heptosyltransferase
MSRLLLRAKRWLLLRYLSGPGGAARQGHLPSDASEIKRIAVWQFGGIGDMIIGAAVVRDLLAAYPHATVDLYCSDPGNASFVSELGERVGGIHRFDAYALDMRSIMGRRARRHFREVLRLHRQRHYDLLLNLHIPKLLDWWFFEILLMRRSGAAFLAGFVPETARPGLLDRQCPTAVVVPRHYLSLYRDLLAPLGVRVGGRGYFPCQATQRGRNLVVMHPGASKPFKRWPVERFIDLGRRLQAGGWQVAIVGDRQESGIGARMAADLPGLINAVGTLSLGEMADLLAGAALFLGNDSAPFHLAVAVGTPSIGLFGAGPPMYSEYPVDDVSVLRVPLACAPCFKNACAYQMECMTLLSVDRVWEKVLEYLQEKGPRVAGTPRGRR